MGEILAAAGRVTGNSDPLAPSVADFPAGSSGPRPPPIPDHELIRRIGAGAYGDVWLARNILGERRAVKIIYRSRFDSPRPFEREFEGIQRFEPISRSHPSQLAILHVGKNDAAGCFYYVMELADPAGTPKPEIRSPKEIRNPNTEEAGEEKRVRASGFDLPSDLGLRTSDFYSPHTLRHDLEQRRRLPTAECVEIGL